MRESGGVFVARDAQREPTHRRKNQGSNEEPIGEREGETVFSSSAPLKMEECLSHSVRNRNTVHIGYTEHGNSCAITLSYYKLFKIYSNEAEKIMYSDVFYSPKLSSLIRKKSRHLAFRVRKWCETPPSLLTENFETIHRRERKSENSLHCLPPGKEFLGTRKKHIIMEWMGGEEGCLRLRFGDKVTTKIA